MAIERELKRIEENALYSSQGQFEQAKQWRRINLVLGLPASVLAAIAGGAALLVTVGRVVVAFIALLAAAFGTIQTSLNASHRMNQATAAANAYLEIKTAARQVREIDLLVLPIDELRAELAELTARCDEQNKTAEPFNLLAYRRARKNIAEGGQRHEVDK